MSCNYLFRLVLKFGCILFLCLAQGCSSLVCYQVNASESEVKKEGFVVGVQINQIRLQCQPKIHAKRSPGAQSTERLRVAGQTRMLDAADFKSMCREQYPSLFGQDDDGLLFDVEVDCKISAQVQNWWSAFFTLTVIPLKTHVDMDLMLTLKLQGADEQVAAKNLAINTRSAESITPTAYLANAGCVPGVRISPDEIPEQIIHAIVEVFSQIPEDELKRLALIQQAGRMIYKEN